MNWHFQSTRIKTENKIRNGMMIISNVENCFYFSCKFNIDNANNEIEKNFSLDFDYLPSRELEFCFAHSASCANK